MSPVGRANNRAAPGAGAISAGFTLVELLVVITILSVLALGAGLSSGGIFARGEASAPGMARDLQDGVRFARDQALLRRMPTGLHPARDGWRVVQRDAEGAWQPLNRVVETGTVRLIWTIDGERFLPDLSAPRPDDRPAVLFRPDGGGRPFAVILSQDGRRIGCRFDGWSAVTCE